MIKIPGRLIIFFFCTFGILFSAASSELSLGLDDWPPFSGPQVGHRGLSEEVLVKVFQNAGYQAKIRILPWARIELGLQNGDLDVIGNLYEIPNIKKYASYSKPYYHSKVKFLVRRDFNLPVRKLEDLAKMKIAYGIGYSFGEAFDQAKFLTKVAVPLTGNGIEMVLKNRVDMVIDSEEVLIFHLKKLPPGEAQKLKLLSYVVRNNSMSIGVMTSNPNRKQILQRFNQSLGKLKKTGEIDSIIQKYKEPL